MVEANRCLWDTNHTHCTNRGIKQIAYVEIATLLDTNIPPIRTQINGLEAQLGQGMVKEESTKSEQSNDGLYSSKWINYDKLSFLVLVIEASKSRDTLKRINLQEDENEKEAGSTPVAKRKTLANKKLDFKFTEAITARNYESVLTK